MPFDVTVVVATFGKRTWRELARERAIPSARSQAPVVYVHGQTLAEARNAGLDQVETEFTIHLDADDELEPGYVEAMAQGSADLRSPSVRYVPRGGPPSVPQVWSHRHACTAECLRQGNWLVIGTCVRTELLRSVGGWEEFGWSEDWAAWARCWRAGGTVEACPDAIYRAHRRLRSRNRVTQEEGLRWHREIEEAVFGKVTV